MLRQAGTLIALFQSVALTIAYSQSDPAARQDATKPTDAFLGLLRTIKSPPNRGRRRLKQPPAPTWSIGPIELQRLVDGYYSFNANHPASGFNQLRNFDFRANQFSLNMAELSDAA